ncbi:TlpA disulfide reductase family protein [Dysgonomonas sp. 25]|uniref:TlpA family protein disulfide reductase n=1 Tax=Dysgonomonas sp. 25 TaxID=2302933 RepID=UPI0013D5BCC8|nr:TlpA disulfide reductase family protein [Dysgonomonas sp. 25]NDV67928.1 TlpA family protein disulfide reductase [Dysgonomonas sp. 25]
MKYIFLYCFVLFLLSINTSCSTPPEQVDTLPSPVIKQGVAKISGNITGNTPIYSFNLYIHAPVTHNNLTYEIPVNTDGSFEYEVLLETDKTITTISSNVFEKYIQICLSTEKETILNLDLNGGEITDVTLNGAISFNKFDITTNSDLFVKMSQYSAYDSLHNEFRSAYDVSPDTYLRYINEMIDYRIEKVVSDNQNLSPWGKIYLSNDFKLFCLSSSVFFYTGEMEMNYKDNNPKERWSEFVVPEEPKKSYYSFLKDLNLNDPIYLYNVGYSRILEQILKNNTLAIPAIGDTPIDIWLREVKEILSELVGFDESLFYDLLVTHAFALQFNDKLIPLSDKQKENIHNYFKNSDIETILLQRNDEIIRLAKGKSIAVVNETPVVEKEKLMSAILSKYKRKVVIVDFWATWCGPCLDAMQEIRGLKANMKDKDVVYVYITNPSSPKKAFDAKIEGIGGEHYYLSEEEWEYILDKYEFTGIPTYLIFDKDGKFVNKYVGYPGNDVMEKEITNLLP